MSASERSPDTVAHHDRVGRVREPRPWGVVLAGLLVFFGIVGIAGNALHISALLASPAGWPKPKLLPSVELTLVGVAFFGLLNANRSVALTASAVASVVGLAGVFGALGALQPLVGSISLSSAVLFSTLAFAMLIAAAANSERDEERALGIAGFVVVALVSTIFAATALGVLDPVADRNVAGSSLQTLLTALAIGVYWLSVLWSSGHATLGSADWLPVGVSFAALLTVFVLWRALTVRETNQLRALAVQASEAQSLAMDATLRALGGSLSRAAQRKGDGATPYQQAREMVALRRDLSGVDTAYFLPLHDNSTQDGPEAPRLREFSALWHQRVEQTNVLPDSIAYWSVDSAARRFAVVAPSCVNNVCDGAIIGLAQSDRLFASIASDTALGFYHALGVPPTANNGIAQHFDSLSMVQADVHVGDVHLRLFTWPTLATESRVRSKLPMIVLAMGVLLSGLLLVTTTLGQNARRLATSREKARIASVLERSTDGIWEWELLTDVADHSAGIWRNLGYTASPTSNTREEWQGLIHPEDVEGFNRALQRHLKGDSGTFEHEYRVRSQNGEWHTIVDRARIVERAPTGQPLRLLGVRADVTEARNSQESRLLNERRFRAIFDSGFQYQLLLDFEGVVVEVNRVALEACHVALADVVGKPVWSTLWWAATPGARDALRDALATAKEGSAARYEGEVRCGDGPSSTLEIALKPFLDRAGHTNQLLLEARDITVRRRAEAALQEVDTLTTMGRVAARVAHEINNPLAGIQNSFLLIKGAIPVTHPHYAYVGAIEREIDRIAAVTRQLYETYRPEQDSGGGTSVRSLVSDAVSFLAQVNRGTHVRIETDFSNLPSVIQLPSAMLRQIVYNLAQNAIEASPSGQIVSINANMTDSRLQLSVRDRGAGVPAELRDRIFDPFFSTKDRGVRTGGMGLGLALVRRTVTAAGGSIDVQDAPDGGSIFTVTLPVPSGAQGEDA